jgi:hypothetical protein
LILYDYKFTSAWAVMNDKIEWEQQLNLYGWLLRKVKNKNIAGLRICALIRDWSKHDTREGYPPKQIHVIEIPLWDFETADRFVRARLDQHKESKVTTDLGGDLPLCTEHERWQSETMYAVRREGRKTAIKVLRDHNEAKQLAEKEKGYVEIRNGEPKRCTGNYCGVAEFCDQYRMELAEAERQRAHGEEAEPNVS